MKKKYWISLPTHKQNQFEWLGYLDFQTIVLALVHSLVSQLLSVRGTPLICWVLAQGKTMLNYSPKCIRTNAAVCSSSYLGMVDFTVRINQPPLPDHLLPSFPKIHKGGPGNLRLCPHACFQSSSVSRCPGWETVV